MKVAKVAGEGEELQTLKMLKMFEQNCADQTFITPLESQEAILPPTEESDMRVTGARCSL